MKRVILSAMFITSILSASAQSGEELFKAKCSVCHKMGEPKHDKNAVAPMLIGVATHLQESFKTKEERVKHIQEFVINPTKDKAICPSVKKFGLMPSQKGNVTEDELAKIANWMAEQKGMSEEKHKMMEKKEEHNGMMNKRHKMMEYGEHKGHHKRRGLKFEKIDLNGDGSISKEEFEAFKENRRKHYREHFRKEGKEGCSK